MREVLYITWLNYLGGFEYWPFVSYVDHMINVTETGETKQNIFPQWPKSYGSFADTITKQTFRKTKKQKVIRTQALSRDHGLLLGEQLKSSPLVQLISTRRDRRTVIIDSDSIVVVKGREKLFNFSFTITYTDDYPTQHV